MVLRDGRPSDAESIERIRIRGWQTAYRGIYPADFLDALPLDWSRWELRLSAPPPGWSIFVAELEGRVIGFAVVCPSSDEQGVGELGALYVDPERWSRGAGRALLGRAEERLAARYREGTLWVLEENDRSRRFYELAGWAPDGAVKPFAHGGHAPSAVRYRKRLSSSASRS